MKMTCGKAHVEAGFCRCITSLLRACLGKPRCCCRPSGVCCCCCCCCCCRDCCCTCCCCCILDQGLPFQTERCPQADDQFCKDALAAAFFACIRLNMLSVLLRPASRGKDTVRVGAGCCVGLLPHKRPPTPTWQLTRRPEDLSRKPHEHSIGECVASLSRRPLGERPVTECGKDGGAVLANIRPD